MKHLPALRFELPAAGVHPLSDAIREAIGAGPDEPVEVQTPQFTRPAEQPAPGQPPASLEDWERYRHLTLAALRALGFGIWDTSGALIPGEWFGRLPAGLVLESIAGHQVVVGRDSLSSDIRYGCLAYVLRLHPRTVDPARAAALYAQDLNWSPPWRYGIRPVCEGSEAEVLAWVARLSESTLGEEQWIDLLGIPHLLSDERDPEPPSRIRTVLIRGEVQGYIRVFDTPPPKLVAQRKAELEAAVRRAVAPFKKG